MRHITAVSTIAEVDDMTDDELRWYVANRDQAAIEAAWRQYDERTNEQREKRRLDVAAELEGDR